MFKKKNIFRLILILIPFIVFAALELILRIADYGTNLNVVAEVDKGGKKYYTMNQYVGRRYFDENRLYYRKGSHDFFEEDKQPNTIRVFCFGASTTAGFPYEYNAIPSEFLRDRLIDALPGKNIEVINTAIAATNSYTVSEFVNELSNYKPDLFIIYMGQNEFYGAFGVGSTISIGKTRWIVKTYLWLQNFKTFLLIKNIISSISNYFKPPPENEKKILMEQMVENNSIEYGSPDYNSAKNAFKSNYEEIIETAKEKNIPIIISTLVTNEKDLSPFVTINAEGLSDSSKNKFSEYCNNGNKLLKERNFLGSIDSFNKALSIDSLPANIHYKLGLCYDSLKKYNEAETQFALATNLDGLRFRAPSEFNVIIRRLAARFDIPLSDINKSFRKNSPNGIIGKELLIDHVHPNLKGYFLLAKDWFNTIQEKKLLGLSNNVTEDDNQLWDQSNVTALDSVIGELKIMKLKSRPPFSKDENEFKFKPKNSIEQVAYNYLSESEMSWGMAHMMAAKEYLTKNDLSNAVREYSAILITDETNFDLLSIVGDIYYQLKIYSKADENYSKALSLSQNQFIKYRLGLTNINMDKPEAAVRYFESCLEDNKYSQRQFRASEMEDIRYNLAQAYFQLHENEKALDELMLILKTDPLNKNASSLIKKIKENIR